jgi:hypothetical protein
MSYNKYRGIETAAYTMGDAISQLEDLHLLNPIHQDLASVDYDGESGTGPNEYEMKALPMLINSCIEALDLYFDAVSMDHIELHPRIDVQKLVAMIKSINDEE